MEIRHLTTFVTTVQVGSISKAADILGYSQAAATIQLKQLEEELGVRLFDRMNHKMRITNDGQRFLPFANQILHDLNMARLAMEPETTLTGNIKIGTIESLLVHYLDQIIADFHALHPGVTMQVITGTPEDLTVLLDSNQLDVIFLLEKPINNDAWVQVLKEPEPVVFVSDPRREICKKKNLHAEDLLQEPIILTEKNANYRRAWDKYLSSRHLRYSPFLEISSTNYITHAIQKMNAVSLLPYFVIRHNLEEGTLVQLDVIDFSPEMYRQIFYHRDKWKTREMEEFIRIAKEKR